MAKKRANDNDAEAIARRAAEFSAQRASDHEEVRFTKKQQWAVTAAGMGIMLALYTTAKQAASVGASERLIVLGLILITPLACSWFLWSLQEHLSEVRLRLDPDDKDHFGRGARDILVIFAALLFIGSFLFGYALYR
jgi:hypothetical protein